MDSIDSIQSKSSSYYQNSKAAIAKLIIFGFLIWYFSKMLLKHYLGVTDYVIIGISLLISVGIGIAARMSGSKNKTSMGYLLADKNMSKIPVILSIIVTTISPTAILGMPSEIYRYGAVMVIGTIFMPIGMYLAAAVFLPVYFQCEVSTVNEFLEMRFGRIIRYLLSGLFLVQMVFFMSTSLYGAVLALTAVTNLPLQISIVTLGLICTLYSSIGGLKAVLWTDAYQAILVLVCVLTIYVFGIEDAGGISKVFQTAIEGQRLSIFDFDLDFTKRYTFWNTSIRGFMFALSYFGTNQIEVQRTLSMSTIERAKSALRFSIIPTILTYLVCAVLGLVMFSIFHLCDPVLNRKETGLTRHDQLIPWYIINRLGSIPGMTGLCIAGIFSASLSTISSALNCASTVTVVDIIKPLYKNGTISDTKIVWLAKIFSIIYGVICIGLAFTFLDIRSILQLTTIVVTAIEGPMTAIFLVGVLTRKANDKCVSFALIVGYILTIWISFGALYSKYMSKTLPLSKSMCPAQNITSKFNISSTFCGNDNNCTSPFTTSSPKLSPSATVEPFILYKIAYLWHPFISFLLTSILIFLAVLITGWNKNVIPEDSNCLSPVTRFWMKKTEQREISREKDTAQTEHELPLLMSTKI